MLQLRPNNDLLYAGFTLSSKGITPQGEPSYKQWEKVGEFITRSHEAVQFWRGDWLNYGEDHYDEWTQHFDESEPSAETLRKEKWVAKRIPAERRRPGLSWSHHEEVADLEPDEQEEMFNAAEKDHLSVHKFRQVVRRFKLKLDLPELNDTELEKTDPKVFEKVQEIINASVNTVELLEGLDWPSVHKDARDYLVSHLKRAIGFYVSLVKRNGQ